MSTPLHSDETAKKASESTLQPVKSTENPGHPDHSDTPDFPEGGVTAWSTVLGAFLIQFCGAGYTSSYGVYEGTVQWIVLQNELIITKHRLLYSNLPDKFHTISNRLDRKCECILDILGRPRVRKDA